VESLNTRPLEVVGTPPLVIIFPVLSMLFDRVPDLEATLVPILWKPVFNLPLFKGLMIGFALLLFLKLVPTLASLFAY